jgi:hypothetical protein
MNLFYTSPGADWEEEKEETKESFEELQADEFEEGLDSDEYGDGDEDTSWPGSGTSDEDEE